MVSIRFEFSPYDSLQSFSMGDRRAIEPLTLGLKDLRVRLVRLLLRAKLSGEGGENTLNYNATFSRLRIESGG